MVGMRCKVSSNAYTDSRSWQAQSGNTCPPLARHCFSCSDTLDAQLARARNDGRAHQNLVITKKCSPQQIQEHTKCDLPESGIRPQLQHEPIRFEPGDR